MRIVFKMKDGKQHSYEIDALHVTDYYENEYYIDDSTKAAAAEEEEEEEEEEEGLVVSKYDHKIQEGLYPVWLPYEKQQNYFKSACRDRKIDEILGD